MNLQFRGKGGLFLKQFQWICRRNITNSNFPFPQLTNEAKSRFESQVYVFSLDELESTKKQLNILPKQIESLKKNKVDWFYSADNLSYLLAHDKLKLPVSKQNTSNDQQLQKEKSEQEEQKLADSIVNLGSKAARTLHAKKVGECDIRLPTDFEPKHTANLLKGFLLSNYKFEDFDKQQQQKTQQSTQAQANEEEQSPEEKHFKPITQINLINQNLSNEIVDFNVKSSFYTLYARQLSNLRADVGNTLFFKNEVENLFKDNKEVHIECLVGDQVYDQGLRLAHAVGRASASPPIAINMTYYGNKDNKEDLHCFVGKGLCFDAGGLNIKPTGYMETMYMDKSGACAVIAAFRAAVEMKMKVNLTCSIGLAENFLGSRSYRPSDIIKSHKGLTVEIGNTDAEGRLVLADVMSWTQKKHPQIKNLIELSTLTGACMVALGEGMAGLFSNNNALAESVLQSGKEENEPLWRLPITKEHRESIKCDFADLKNSGKSRYGGASQAAAFLESFVEKDVKWVHLDIAGPVESKSAKGIFSAGTTGFGVQTLMNFLKKREAK